MHINRNCRGSLCGAITVAVIFSAECVTGSQCVCV